MKSVFKIAVYQKRDIRALFMINIVERTRRKIVSTLVMIIITIGSIRNTKTYRVLKLLNYTVGKKVNFENNSNYYT